MTDPRMDDAKLDAALDALSARVPSPRRTDAAFARSVQDGVRTKKQRSVFVMFPLAAAATAAVAVFALVHPAATPSTSHAGHDAGTTTVAYAGDPSPAASFDDDDASPFALPSLDGSSDEELARLDLALDARLQHRAPR